MRHITSQFIVTRNTTNSRNHETSRFCWFRAWNPIFHIRHKNHWRSNQTPIVIMLYQLFLASLTVFACFTPVAKAQACIGTLGELDALQTSRGNDVATQVTYVMCPNTVYLANDEELLYLNGNANYLCGADGSSANNCIIRGGSLQLAIFLPTFDSAPKDNILVSGFIFEQSTFSNAAISMSGRSTIRDCIFRVRSQCYKMSVKWMLLKPVVSWKYANAKLIFSVSCFPQNNFHHSVVSFDFYIPATLRRQLTSDGAQLPSWMHQAAADHEELKKRALLIGGGSEPRVTTAFENCQFLNNSLTTEIEIPLLAQNGVMRVNSAFSDVSITDCLFRDNFYDFRRDGPVRHQFLPL